MILVGALVKKLGIVDEAGRRCLTDLCINVIIPCNILKSCLIDIDSSVLRACGILLAVALAIQFVSVAPVSYTHLDVYKRQAQASSCWGV